MALSPNYGWAEPDNSSLVKNGAQDIRALGDAIDTSVWNVGYGQSGKNKIINGDFNINQRSFTSTTTSATYGYDRWRMACSGSTATYSAQTFTLGAAPVSGYEGKNFARLATAAQSAAGDFTIFSQFIESVRTFAGQTVTVSLWAKAASGTPKIAVEFVQAFGTGGSPSADVNTYAGQITLSTSWTRYSVSVAVPSISGKTIGTGNNDSLGLFFWTSAGSTFNSRTGSLGIQNDTIDFWGVQVEYGSKATPFQTATGTIQGELAACQRYYFRNAATNAQFSFFLGGFNTSTTAIMGVYTLPVTMRTPPTLQTTGTASNYRTFSTGGSINLATVPAIDTANESTVSITATVASGLTAGGGVVLLANGSTAAFLGFTSEL